MLFMIAQDQLKSIKDQTLYSSRLYIAYGVY
jgi:hypothetical protein